MQKQEQKNEQPYGGSVWKITPQLQRSYKRWKRIPTGIKTRLVYWSSRIKAYFSTPKSSLRGPWLSGNAKRVCCTPRRFRQNTQRNRQSSPDDQRSPPETTFQKSAIKQIDFMGMERVYDLEIETDHCYIANGIFVHNSKPNLQQIPSGSIFAKLIKACFACNADWLFMGSDFDALEDKTGALLTQDPNRLKIYTDGFCGHCLRSQSYWPEEMVDIDPLSVNSINSIKKLYPKQRQLSKAPSFALQYMGTWHTLMKNCGFSEKMAKSIEDKYHELYEISDKWLADKLEKAKETGFIPMAFGGRIRTPLIHGATRLSYKAQKEGRSAGNAATQSYCVLTLRAMNEFMDCVWDSPYALDILPVATIHDAIYLMVRNKLGIVHWVNENLIDCMAWQELPEIQHETIKLSSSLEVFYPNWGNVIEIPNNASMGEIRAICRKEVNQ